MVRGINKRVISVKIRGNELYEEAWFILKQGARLKESESEDMSAEISRVLNEREGYAGRGKRGRRILLALVFLAGAVLGAILWAIIMASWK